MNILGKFMHILLLKWDIKALIAFDLIENALDNNKCCSVI